MATGGTLTASEHLLNAAGYNVVGAIVLIDFSPTAFENGGVTLKVAATPADKDILPLRGQIITIRDADIKINVIDDNLISLTTR